jgi:hypothetical protein
MKLYEIQEYGAGKVREMGISEDDAGRLSPPAVARHMKPRPAQLTTVIPGFCF